MYEDGLGTERDYFEAANLYRSAAEHNDITARFNLASLYASGKGVPLDYISAYVWYSLAASQGDKLSALRLRELKRLITPNQLAQAESRLLDQQRLEGPSSHADDARLAPVGPSNNR